LLMEGGLDVVVHCLKGRCNYDYDGLWMTHLPRLLTLQTDVY